MTAAALHHDALLPRPPGGNGAGAALALLVHAGLVVALTTVVDWRAHAPDVVSAELWASVPQIAAPQAETAPAPAPAPTPAPAPAPAPPPPAPRVEAQAAEPDIAIARAERRKAEAEARKVAEAEAEARKKAAAAERLEADAERRRAEAEARKKADEDKRRAAAEKERQEAAARKADDERLARQREENLKRIIGQAGGATSGSGGTGSAARSAAPSAAYAGLVAARIRPNIVYTGTVSGDRAAEVEVRAAAGGTIIARRLVKSSGHDDWDTAVLRAIDRTPSLPRDADGRVPPTLIITFRPND